MMSNNVALDLEKKSFDMIRSEKSVDNNNQGTKIC